MITSVRACKHCYIDNTLRIAVTLLLKKISSLKAPNSVNHQSVESNQLLQKLAFQTVVNLWQRWIDKKKPGQSIGQSPQAECNYSLFAGETHEGARSIIWQQIVQDIVACDY